MLHAAVAAVLLLGYVWGAPSPGTTDAIVVQDVRRSVYVASSVLREEAVVHLRVPQNSSAWCGAAPPLVLVAPAGLWAARVSHVRAALAADRNTALSVAELSDKECADAVSKTAHAATSSGRYAAVAARCFAVDLRLAVSAALKTEDTLRSTVVSPEGSVDIQSSSHPDVPSIGSSAIAADSKDRAYQWHELPTASPEDARTLKKNNEAPHALDVSVLVGISYGRVASASPSRGTQDSIQSFVVPVPTLLATAHVLEGTQSLSIYVAPGLLSTAVQCPAPRNQEPTVAGGDREVPPGTAVYSCGPYPAGYVTKRTRVRVSLPSTTFWGHVARVERTLAVDVARGRVYVTDKYSGISSDSFGLSDDASFSRTAWRLAMRNTEGAHAVFPVVPVCVPASASAVSVRDDLGLLTTPASRRPLARSPETTHVLDVQPRFPLAYGWQTPLEASYSLPLSALGAMLHERSGIALRLSVPLLVPALDWIADEAVVSVKPGGPVVTVRNAGREHEGIVVLNVRIPWTVAYRLPLAACASALLVLPVALRQWRAMARGASRTA